MCYTLYTRTTKDFVYNIILIHTESYHTIIIVFKVIWPLHFFCSAMAQNTSPKSAVIAHHINLDQYWSWGFIGGTFCSALFPKRRHKRNMCIHTPCPLQNRNLIRKVDFILLLFLFFIHKTIFEYTYTRSVFDASLVDLPPQLYFNC